MQAVPRSEDNQLCSAGQVLEAKVFSNFEFLKCSLKKMDKRLGVIENKIDELSSKSTKDFMKIESISVFMDELKSWRSSVENSQSIFAKHISDHEALEAAHRRYSQGWGLFGGLSGASILELIIRGFNAIIH